MASASVIPLLEKRSCWLLPTAPKPVNLYGVFKSETTSPARNTIFCLGSAIKVSNANVFT